MDRCIRTGTKCLGDGQNLAEGQALPKESTPGDTLEPKANVALLLPLEGSCMQSQAHNHYWSFTRLLVHPSVGRREEEF